MDYLTHFTLANLWIIYVFFGNGFLLFLLSYNYFPARSGLIGTFENVLLLSFFLSLLINFCLVHVLFGFKFSLATVGAALSALSCILTACLLIRYFRSRRRTPVIWRSMWSARLLLYVTVFGILLYNGGMIEHVSDAWYHMSIANKITVYNSLDVDNHLNGIASYNYPKLWHANLAVLHSISGISLPEIWNSFTAWGAVLKVSAFYLFALALSDNYRVAFLAALLYFFLPGMGDSYMRVSAWPAHVSYTAMFFLLSALFTYFDSFQQAARKNAPSKKDLINVVSDSVAPVGEKIRFFIIPTLAVIIIYFSHRVELVWVTGAIFFYTLALVSNEIFTEESSETIEPAYRFLLYFSLLVVGGAVVATLATYRHMYTIQLPAQLDHLVVSLGGLTFLLLLLYVCMTRVTPIGRFLLISNRLVLIVLLAAVLWSIDYRHFLSLVFEQMSYPGPSQNEFPLIVQGWFGEKLKLPSWHLQLRGGLMFSGLLSVGVAVGYLVQVRTRLSFFLAANAVIPLIFIISPYGYTWLGDILSYHSVWRISIMIFTPLILATVICSLTKAIVRQ